MSKTCKTWSMESPLFICMLLILIPRHALILATRSPKRSNVPDTADISPSKVVVDRFILAQYSPIGASIHYGKRPVSKQPKWTLHGLWPSNSQDDRGEGLKKCGGIYKPIIDKPIAEMRKDLMESWPNYDPTNTNEIFWAHEYQEHGTCASSTESMNTAKKYFQESLRLLNLHNMKDIMNKANVTPGDIYTLKDLRHKINKVAGAEVQLICGGVTRIDPVQYLYEARLCFDAKLNLVSCQNNSGCNYKKPVRIVDV
ncbi:hypothetical protein QAD02_006269 [Eretmocerus hayati]|uniref:Uncharacterized protein n=1 Tax=Eretmocerus hayati TaxID=131215 RepID=A0ACC2N0K0_9HYME|nr:hypothetical protein QAD02_006269 [Eretmocerus hayati]